MNMYVYEEYSSVPIFHANKHFLLCFSRLQWQKGKAAFGRGGQ